MSLTKWYFSTLAQLDSDAASRSCSSTDPILRFKIQIVLKSKLTLEKCAFASVTFEVRNSGVT